MDSEAIVFKRLEHVHAFFPRADAKASVVLGVDVAMIGSIGADALAVIHWSWWMLVAIVPLGMLAMSLYYIYQCSFPSLSGGDESLLYFRPISGYSKAAFLKLYRDQDETARVDDMLEQIWTNSRILTMKFDALKRSHMWLAASIAPWVGTLITFAAINAKSGGPFH